MATDISKHTIFATFKPASPDARHALNHLRNRRHLSLSSKCSGTSLHLSFDAILGRRCISFGASRLNDVQLFGAHDLYSRHFVLILNLYSRQLYIKDVSSRGTRVAFSPDQNPTTLSYGVVIPVTSPFTVMLGYSDRLRFQVCVADLKSTVFDLAFATYAISLGAKPAQLPVQSSAQHAAQPLAQPVVQPPIQVPENRRKRQHEPGKAPLPKRRKLVPVTQVTIGEGWRAWVARCISRLNSYCRL